MSALVVHNATVVNGDGSSVQKGMDVVTDDGVIREVHPTRPVETYERVESVLKADGALLIPGLVNNHSHGTAYGPLFPSGHERLSREQVRANLDRHLLEGTTTVLCVDGFLTEEEWAATNDDHPMSVRLASCNTPACLEAASIADGGGLTDANRRFSARRAVDAGAVALGEIGAGHTLGGGGASYMYIPAEIEKLTGVLITARQATDLKYAVLGRHIDAGAYDADAVEEAIVGAGLAGKLSAARAKEVISGVVLPAFDIALEGLTEAAATAEEYGVPVLVHNAAASMTQVAKIARTDVTLIAGHSNHSSFEIKEAVEHAEQLKELGAIVDVSTLDTFGAQRMISGPELLYAMFSAGVVDTISTDYAGGHHDGALLAIERATKAGVVSLPQAVAMATANVADAIPGIAPNRGRVIPGAVADLVLTDASSVDNVQAVLVQGELVVEGGKRTAG